MSSNANFFESPQAAAIYKHKLIKSYIPAWVGKVGSTSQNQRVVVYDAYSGPGRYENEQPGSPELLVNTAEAMAHLRSVHSVFSDKDQVYCDRLSQLLLEKGIDPKTYQVRRGPVEDHINAVLSGARNLPLFVFLDPYGLTISFDRVVQVIKARDMAGSAPAFQPKTELLMNFSFEAVRRIAGVVRSPKEFPAKQGQIEALNNALGGEWWHDLARTEPEGWVGQVLAGYASRVGQATGCRYITAEVADSLTSEPVYELIHFTRHSDGFWEMARSMSMARKEWRQWVVDAREKAMGGQFELRGLDFEDDESAWVLEIAHNMEAILRVTSGFTIEDKLDEVLGRTLGLARETHIRQALKLLRQREVVASVPTGKLQRAYIARN
jgi:three-Cys-motif partner protein